VDLVALTVGELGFPEGATYAKICERARVRGLELCTPEVGPRLRLQYLDQPMDEWIIIAMEPIAGSDGGLNVFSVDCYDDGLWLRTGYGNPDRLWYANHRFVFVRPRGSANIIEEKHIIDCDADPFIPDGWTVVEHKKAGKLEWHLKKVALYLSERQKNCGRIQGHALRQEIEGQPVMNACVLDFLLAHKELIPDEWEANNVLFWGTIYRDPNGYLYVRGLAWCGGRWDWGCCCPDDDFRASLPAAVSASV